MESKAAVLGDADFVMPFSALGLDTYAVEDSAEQVEQRAKEILEGNYGLIVVAENIAPKAEKVFSKVRSNATPCILIVPFTTESEGYAVESLGGALARATGVNILKKD